MKKIFKFLPLLLLALVAFTACNEDTDEADNSKTQQIMGTWRAVVAASNNIQTETYTFKPNEFTYLTTRTDSTGTNVKGYQVDGTWNIRKSVLQLSFSLQTLRCMGMSQAEVDGKMSELRDHNTLLGELNENGRTLGSVVTFDNVGGKKVMRLSGILGTFEKVSY